MKSESFLAIPEFLITPLSLIPPKMAFHLNLSPNPLNYYHFLPGHHLIFSFLLPSESNSSSNTGYKKGLTVQLASNLGLLLDEGTPVAPKDPIVPKTGFTP